MSWVNAGEVYYRMHRSHGPAHADRTLDTLRHSLRLDNADPDRVVHAASIKAVHRMSYADAFACATAIAHGATILTGDDEILRASGEWRAEDIRVES